MINKLHPAGHGIYLNQKRDILVKNVIFFPGNASQLNSFTVKSRKTTQDTPDFSIKKSRHPTNSTCRRSVQG